MLASDDWEALYVDGICAHQSHHISLREFVSIMDDCNVDLGIRFVAENASRADAEEATQLGSFPAAEEHLKGDYR